MSSKRILLVEDEESIAKLVEYNLLQADYDVIRADNGRTALSLIQSEPLDLVILDIMLPELSGTEVCQQVRMQGIQTPIIMLTAKDHEVDRIVGLEIGADDYVTKPFSPRELVARVKAVLRRGLEVKRETPIDKVIRFGLIEIDPNKYEIRLDRKLIDLTQREFELILYLARNIGNVSSREHLLDRVWGYDFAGDTRVVDVHISNLRDKIESDPKNPTYIKTVRGVGYKLVHVDEWS